MSVSIKRFQQGVFEALASSNRFAGSGGGAGLVPMQSLGITSVFVNTGGLTSTSYTTMPGNVAITFTVPRTVNLMMMFFATAWITAGGGQIRIRCNVPGLSTASGPFKFGVTNAATNAFGHLYLAAVTPGTYTAQMEYQVDNGTTGFIDQSYVQGFQLGA